MQLALIVFSQTLTMALYMLLGYALFKGGKITVEGSRSIASLLIWMIIPSVIINSFLVEFTPEKAKLFAASFAVGLAALLLAMLVARICFNGRGIDQFAAAFSNAGFIGIPLVQASLGADAVFFIVGLIITLNLAQWTYGAALIKKEKGNKTKTNVKELFLNPIVISAIVGFFLFITGLGTKLPAVLSGCIKGVAALNAPLAMIVLGVYLAQTKLVSQFTNPRIYLISAVRLVLIPALTIALFAVLPVDSTMKMAVLISASAPVGANVAVYAQLYDADYAYACQTVTQSTILSIVVLPLVIMVARMFF